MEQALEETVDSAKSKQDKAALQPDAEAAKYGADGVSITASKSIP
jgi:hypothetical protein